MTVEYSAVKPIGCSAMLPRAERLSSAEFDVVFVGGRVLRHPLLQLRVMRRESGGTVTCARTAFVVPKKTGKAAMRNRLRRRVRERYRMLRTGSTAVVALAGCDLVWIISSAALAVSFVELDEALSELLRRGANAAGRVR